MQKKNNKKLIINLLLIIESLLTGFLFVNFYRSGCKISDFLENTQKILTSPEHVDAINLSTYFDTLFLFMASLAIVVTYSLRPEKQEKSGNNSVLKQTKNVNKRNFLVKDSVIEEQKLQLKQFAEKNEKIAQEGENIKDIKNRPQLSDSQNHESEAGRPKSENALTQSFIEDSQNNMITQGPKSLINDVNQPTILNEGRGELNNPEGLKNNDENKELNSPENIPASDQEIQSSKETSQETDKDFAFRETPQVREFFNEKPSISFDDFKSEIEIVKEDLLDAPAIYGPGQDEDSLYDADGFHEFYSRYNPKNKRSNNDQGTLEENKLRQVIRDEFYGLVDQTSVKMSENYERLNQILREITSLKDEIKEIQKGGNKDAPKIQKELNPRLAMLREMEAEGQMMLDEIDENKKKEAQEKYSKYALV